MIIRVLGAAAGGGFPQWNCGCPNCRAARAGGTPARPRTQESVAISAEGDGWVVLNASPDVRQQIEAFPALHPRGVRDTPVRAFVLTNGDLDHCLGLLVLRESEPLTVYATERVRRGFVEHNAAARTLERFRGQVDWKPLVPGVGVALPGGLTVEPVATPGRPPLHLVDRLEPAAEDNVGLLVRAPGTAGSLAYFPGVGAVTPAVHEALRAADCAFVDGTFWSSDELVALGIVARRAEQMGHVPVGGPDGTLATLGDVRGRRLYIHVNNTNPLLREDSAAHATVRAAGWEVAYDGLDLTL
jgi:pyrroloquinoline quinone biosynthesis protein B